MHPILVKIGPIIIYTYGFFVFLGVIISYWLSLRTAVSEGIDKEKISNLIFWSIIFGFVGARIVYILVEWSEFLDHPFKMLLDRSGFVFYGGVIGGGLTFLFLAKRYQLDFLKCADIIARYIPLGHAFGRLGCFFYGCCYGKPTISGIGLKFPPESPAGRVGMKVIPVQLISALCLLIIFFILQRIKKVKKFQGQMLVSYLFLYGVFRFAIEFFRGDPRGFIGIFSISQWFSLGAVIVAIYYNKKLQSN